MRSLRNPLHNTALRYAIVVGLWILIIDFLSDRLISDGRWFLALHAGLALFTFLVLYALLKRELAARQQAETHRRVSEERLANILSTAADAIIAVDQDLEIIVFNRAAETIFGYQVDKVIGQPLDILIPGRYAEVYRQYFQTFVRSSETSHQMHQYQEVFARRKNGTEFPAEVSLSKLIQHGQSTITMIVRDVTIRRQAIEALQWAKDDLEQRIQDRTASLAKANIALQTEIQERARAEKEREVLLLQVEQERQNVQALANTLERERDILHIIMENTRTQLAYLDSQFNYVRVNSAYALGSGHREEEFIGRNHFELFPNLENKAIFEQVRETGQPVQFLARPFEYVGQPERGTTYWDWTLVPVAAGEGLVQGLVLSLLEVTELKQAEEALRQAYGELELRIQERTRALAKANEELRTENAERRQV